MTALETPTIDAGAVFHQLYADFHAPTLARIRRTVGSPEAAEDILQETWRKVFGALPEYLMRPNFNGLGLLVTTADRVAIDHLRRGELKAAGGRVRFESLDVPPPGSGERPGQAGLVHPALVAPEETEAQALAVTSLGKPVAFAALLLELLPVQYRRVLWLREWRGYDYADIATALRTTVPSVKSLLYRARARQRVLTPYLAGQGQNVAPGGLEARFWTFVPDGKAADPAPCWRWLGSHTSTGRPAFSYWWGAAQLRRTVNAGRFAYILRRGVIPPWACIGQSCGHIWCANPWHQRLQGKVGRGRHQAVSLTSDAPGVPADGPPAWTSLRRPRSALGLSQEALGALVGMAQSTVSTAERGHDGLPLTTNALLAALDRLEHLAEGDVA